MASVRSTVAVADFLPRCFALRSVRLLLLFGAALVWWLVAGAHSQAVADTPADAGAPGPNASSNSAPDPVGAITATLGRSVPAAASGVIKGTERATATAAKLVQRGTAKTETGAAVTKSTSALPPSPVRSIQHLVREPIATVHTNVAAVTSTVAHGAPPLRSLTSTVDTAAARVSGLGVDVVGHVGGAASGTVLSVSRAVGAVSTPAQSALAAVSHLTVTRPLLGSVSMAAAFPHAVRSAGTHASGAWNRDRSLTVPAVSVTPLAVRAFCTDGFSASAVTTASGSAGGAHSAQAPTRAAHPAPSGDPSPPPSSPAPAGPAPVGPSGQSRGGGDTFAQNAVPARAAAMVPNFVLRSADRHDVRALQTRAALVHVRPG